MENMQPRLYALFQGPWQPEEIRRIEEILSQLEPLLPPVPEEFGRPWVCLCEEEGGARLYIASRAYLGTTYVATTVAQLGDYLQMLCP